MSLGVSVSFPNVTLSTQLGQFYLGTSTSEPSLGNPNSPVTNLSIDYNKFRLTIDKNPMDSIASLGATTIDSTTRLRAGHVLGLNVTDEKALYFGGATLPMCLNKLTYN